MNVPKNKNGLAYAICSVAGIGYFPQAPGTFASALATILYFVISPNWQGLFLGIIIALVLGLLFTGQVELLSGKDPAFIVIDEFAGQWLTFLFLPQNDLIIVIAGFILFRVFDILKPLGIDKVQKLKSGRGVMLDDLLAALYANLTLHVLIYSGVFG